MTRTAYVTHSDCSLHDTGWKHPEHQGRLAKVSRAVYRDMLTLFEPMREMEGVPATEADLLLAHDERYIERVRGAAAEAAESGEVVTLEGEVRVSGASWDAVRAAVGCGITAVDAVLAGDVANAFCAVRPPGHQAGIARPGGYCIFNTVAVAARHALDRRGLERLLVVEISAAPGTGTAEILGDSRGVRFATVHQDPERELRWPANASVERLPAGADGAAALAALERAMDSATDGFRPELVLLSLGLDALATDPVGGLGIAVPEVHTLTRAVMARAADLCHGRLVSVLEGGYDASATGAAVVQHLRAMTGLEPA